MHFRTGGISRDLNPHIAHPAAVRSPLVINELFWNYSGWHDVREQSSWFRMAVWDSGNGSILDFPPRFYSLSLLGHTSEWRSFTSHACASALGCYIFFYAKKKKKKRSNLCHHVIQGHTRWSAAKQKLVLSSITEVGDIFPLLSDCQIWCWLEISRLDVFWKTLLRFTNCLRICSLCSSGLYFFLTCLHQFHRAWLFLMKIQLKNQSVSALEWPDKYVLYLII